MDCLPSSALGPCFPLSSGVHDRFLDLGFTVLSQGQTLEAYCTLPLWAYLHFPTLNLMSPAPSPHTDENTNPLTSQEICLCEVSQPMPLSSLSELLYVLPRNCLISLVIFFSFYHPFTCKLRISICLSLCGRNIMKMTVHLRRCSRSAKRVGTQQHSSEGQPASAAST